MAGKLDEISRVIGQQEANLAGLNRTFDQHVIDDDRRHNPRPACLVHELPQPFGEAYPVGEGPQEAGHRG